MGAILRRMFVLLVCLLVVAVARAQDSVPPLIAEARRDFVDSHRKNWNGTGPRPLTTTVWTPSEISMS